MDAGQRLLPTNREEQADWPAETAGPDQLVQVAIVYSGRRIRIYRNGRPYADYEAGGRQTFSRQGDVLVGARYRAGPGSETGFFAGEIDEVRLYDRALKLDAIKAMVPGKPGVPRPLGMWTFDGGSVADRMGNYPRAYLRNGASIVDGRLRLNGRRQYMLVTEEAPMESAKVQAGFFTPRRVGKMWDTWLYYHEGTYYLYYLAGGGGHWDGHELAVSEDGVHWTEHGVVIKPRNGVKWMGTGHIWESPDFDRTGTWVMNYSEWFGPKQDIMFATSTDLLNWTKVDEKHRFVQDTRWYKPHGRWDCIDTVRRGDGSLLGYFTADPVREKVKYRCCGFGMAESRDGITWTALPPPGGDISGEFGGIQKIGSRYFILISEGRVAVGDKPEGPFCGQKKNHNAFGRDCDIYFPRFFHNAPGGPLVNHFYRNGPVFAAPLKAVEVDREGTLRLRWWRGNNKLKSHRVETALVPGGKGYATSIRLFDEKLPRDKVHVIEGVLDGARAHSPGYVRHGIFFDHGDGRGHFLSLNSDSASFGTMKADGSDVRVLQTRRRDIHFGPRPTFRLVIKYDMMELYLNDYLMDLRRVPFKGRLGLIEASTKAFGAVEVWQSQ